MSLAFFDPPLSGSTSPARRCRAGSKAEGSIWTARSASASALGPLEIGRPLGQEGLDAFHEVGGRGHLLLRRRLELELLVHARVDPGVEPALPAGARARRPGPQTCGPRSGRGFEGFRGPDAVYQAPLERLPGAD